LKDAGKSAVELKEGGLEAGELKTCLFSCADLKQAGFSSASLKDALCSASELKDAGFPVNELAAAGFHASQLKDAGFSAKDLKNAGFTISQLKSALYTIRELMDAKFQPSEFKVAGFTASELHPPKADEASSSRWEAGWLLQAGYFPGEIRDAAVSAVELRKAGASLEQLETAGYAPFELKEAGFTASELKGAGVQLSRLKAAGFDVGSLKAAGFDVEQLRNVANIGVAELRQGGFTAWDLHAAGISIEVMKTAGFTAADLKDVFSCRQLKWGGFKLAQLLAAGMSTSECKTAGFPLHEYHAYFKHVGGAHRVRTELLNAGYHLAELRKESKNTFTASELKQAGMTADKLAWLFSPKELKEGGYTLLELENLRLSAKELTTAGFSLGEVAKLGMKFKVTDFIDPKNHDLQEVLHLGGGGMNLKEAGLEPVQLLEAEYKASDIRRLGYDISSFKWLGLPLGTVLALSNLADLKENGWTLEMFHAAGCEDVAGLKSIGYSAKELLDVGFTAESLKGHFNLWQLRQAGCIKEELMFAQYTTTELDACNPKVVSQACSAWELMEAHHSHAELKEGGFTTVQLKEAGATLQDLVKANYSVKELRDASYPLRELLNPGYGLPPRQFSEALYTIPELRDAGMTLQSMNLAGFGRLNIISEGGFDIPSLKNSEFAATAKELKDAGVPMDKITGVKYSLTELEASGLTVCGYRALGASYVDLKADANVTKDAMNACLQSDLGKARLNAAELSAAGVSATALLSLGFPEQAVKAAHPPTKELLEAGMEPVGAPDIVEALKAVKADGLPASKLTKLVKPQQLKDAKYTAFELLEAGVRNADVAQAYSQPEIDSAMEALVLAVDTATLKLGWTKQAAVEAGLTLQQAGVNESSERREIASFMALKHYTAPAMLKRGFSAAELKEAARFSAVDLAYSGMSAGDLSQGGFADEEIWNAGKALTIGGHSLDNLRERGFDTAMQLYAGFKKDEVLKKAAPSDVASALKKLRSKGVTVLAMQNLGMDNSDLKTAGYSFAEMSEAGYTLKDLLSAQYSMTDAMLAGKTKKDLVDAGASNELILAAAKALKTDHKFTVGQMKIVGMNTDDLKALGYPDSQLQTGLIQKAGKVQKAEAHKEQKAEAHKEQKVEAHKEQKVEAHKEQKVEAHKEQKVELHKEQKVEEHKEQKAESKKHRGKHHKQHQEVQKTDVVKKDKVKKDEEKKDEVTKDEEALEALSSEEPSFETEAKKQTTVNPDLAGLDDVADPEFLKLAAEAVSES